MKNVLLSVIAALLVSVTPAAAQHHVEEDIKYLDTAELKAIFGKGKFTLVNTLSPVEFMELRIAGSINVPLSHYADEKVSLPADRKARLVFYCMGQK